MFKIWCLSFSSFVSLYELCIFSCKVSLLLCILELLGELESSIFEIEGGEVLSNMSEIVLLAMYIEIR